MSSPIGDHDELEELNFRFHRAVNLLADSPKLAWLLGITLCYVPARFHSTIDGRPPPCRITGRCCRRSATAPRGPRGRP